ncbi:DUF484 family protein [Tropicimonas sp. IMCC34043]|uniref:DUF484 family protein n=1 Tax=Tropicimonas sp. IMCC34043 TaxID=2248760 RepID=UPI000E27B0CD|nr:DUF484 family protein [Tropicimonas sp. IMCC34043]
MSNQAGSLNGFRDKILAEPDVILEDRDIMRALVAANDRSLGGNVIDLRGVAMARLETRLDRLEDTHRSVIAAAYDNLAGTQQIHRAVLSLMEPVTFEEFLATLAGDVASILRIDCLRLVLETAPGSGAVEAGQYGDSLLLTEPGFVASYLRNSRGAAPGRDIVLRRVRPDAAEVYGPTAAWLGSEALLRLDFGDGCLPGMLVLGAEDPEHFCPSHATDLLAFLAGIFERQMRRWLS